MGDPFPDLPKCLDRKINGIRAVPTISNSKLGATSMSLEQEIATLTGAVKELTAVVRAANANTKTAPAQETAPEVKQTKEKKSKGDDTGDKSPGPADKGGGKTETKGGGQKVVTYPEVSAAITKVSKEKGRERAIEILAAFNVKSGKDLPADSFAEVIALCNAALEAEDEELV